MSTWTNWSRLETSRPTREATPADASDVVAEVRRALDTASTVKMVGTGHSFTAISAPEATMLRPEGLTGIVAVDHDALTVTARAGTPLKVLNAELERLGLSLHNMGDIAEQTLAGAISTGTHGTGGTAAGLVKDPDKARTGFAELTKCTEVADDDDFGWTISGDYIVGSDSTGHAKEIAEAGKKAPLSSDADFQKWTDEAGGPGIVNAYFGRNGVKVLTDELVPDYGGMPDSGYGWSATGPDGETSSGAEEFSDQVPSDEQFGRDPADAVRKALKDFKGAAAGLRFADGGIELSVAGGGVQQTGDGTVGDHVTELPGDTAAVLALAVPEDAMAKLSKDAEGSPFSLKEMLGAGIGLDIPQDLIDFFGSSLSISLGADAPADLNEVSGLGDLPIGALISGDEEKIKAVIEKVEAKTGAQLSDVPATVSSGDGKVAISTKPDYGDELLEDGSLSETKNFSDVVENADDAQAVAYVSFENGWMDAVQKMVAENGAAEEKEVADNVAVLRALGASAWSEGDNGYAKVRLALK